MVAVSRKPMACNLGGCRSAGSDRAYAARSDVLAASGHPFLPETHECVRGPRPMRARTATKSTQMQSVVSYQKHRTIAMWFQALAATVILSLLAACSAPVQVTTASATPNPECMTTAKVAEVLKGQGLTAVVLSADQNEAWRAYDNAHAKQPDPAGFTYVVGIASGPSAVIVGFTPDGCFAYYVSVPRQVVDGALGAES